MKQGLGVGLAEPNATSRSNHICEMFFRCAHQAEVHCTVILMERLPVRAEEHAPIHVYLVLYAPVVFVAAADKEGASFRRSPFVTGDALETEDAFAALIRLDDLLIQIHFDLLWRLSLCGSYGALDLGR